MFLLVVVLPGSYFIRVILSVVILSGHYLRLLHTLLLPDKENTNFEKGNVNDRQRHCCLVKKDVYHTCH